MTESMKDSYDQIIDMLTDVLSDRTIAFRRDFVSIAGSAAGALFLSQAMYWMKTRPDGWFYKSREEWTEETGLTRYEQESARTALKKIGVLEEVRKGCPFQLHFHINVREIYKILSRNSQSSRSGGNTLHSAGSNPMDGDTSTRYSAENNQPYKEAEITHEITTEITHKTSVEGFSLVPKESIEPKKKLSKKEIQEYALAFNPPARIPKGAWDAWIEMRIEKGNCPTPRAIGMAISQMDDLVKEGSDYAAILNKSTIAGYPGLYAASNGNGKSNGNGYQNGQQSRTNGPGQSGHLLDHLPSLEENQRRQREGDERLARKRAERGM